VPSLSGRELWSKGRVFKKGTKVERGKREEILLPEQDSCVNGGAFNNSIQVTGAMYFGEVGLLV
jgi:hypothetical protein